MDLITKHVLKLNGVEKRSEWKVMMEINSLLLSAKILAGNSPIANSKIRLCFLEGVRLFHSSIAIVVNMTHSQMFQKVESDLPAKI